MWFVKKEFIAFYEDEKYLLLTQIFKKNREIFKEKKEYDNKKDLEKYILEQIDENPQTYISTLTFTLNQGVIGSCGKQAYLEHEIDYDNVKSICLGKYSFYISLFELQKIKKEFPFIDFIYSPFALIDYLAKERKNRFYVLIFEKNLILMGYENFIPIYGDIIETKEEGHEEVEEIEDIDLLDDIEDLSEDIDEEIENVDEEAIEEKLDEITSSGIEAKILKFVQDSLKEYYDKYSSDFIEKIILLDTVGIDMETAKIIEDEVLIECEYQKIDALEILNRMSRESL